MSTCSMKNVKGPLAFQRTSYDINQMNAFNPNQENYNSPPIPIKRTEYDQTMNKIFNPTVGPSFTAIGAEPYTKLNRLFTRTTYDQNMNRVFNPNKPGDPGYSDTY